MPIEELRIVGEAAPIGAAGIVAWMWLAERRNAVERDRSLTEAHRRVMEQRMQLDELVTLVRDNTRAVSSVEHGQRQLLRAVRAMAGAVDRASRAGGGVRDAGAGGVHTRDPGGARPEGGAHGYDAGHGGAEHRDRQAG